MPMDAAVVPKLLPDGVEATPAKLRLYEVALDLFSTRTYHAVSTRDISNALGQQPSSLYFHVSSKRDLLYDLAQIGHRTHYDALRRAVLSTSDPAEQLYAVTAAHVRQHLDYPALARVTNREMHALTPEQLTDVLALRRQSEQVFIDVIDRGVTLGVFFSTNSYLDAKAIGAMAVRLPEWWTPESPCSRDEIVERYSRHALAMLSRA